jgi:hypothetical protein
LGLIILEFFDGGSGSGNFWTLVRDGKMRIRDPVYEHSCYAILQKGQPKNPLFLQGSAPGGYPHGAAAVATGSAPGSYPRGGAAAAARASKNEQKKKKKIVLAANFAAFGNQ